MKIYHTETQEDYDALMVELEEEGVSWFNGVQMTKKPDNWGVHKKHTYVRVDGVYAFYDSVYFHEWRYPDIPITKYKAKADEKMKFTKENVYKLAERYSVDQGYLIGDLKSDISKLDDTPEKVVVPKFVADYLEERKRDGDVLVTSLYPYQGNSGEAIEDWFEEEENNVSFARAWIDGYTIEPEKLYYIPLPHLETSDGLQQVLSKRKNGNYYFANRPSESLKQRFTKEELERVPEVYRAFAKLIEEETE